LQNNFSRVFNIRLSVNLGQDVTENVWKIRAEWLKAILDRPAWRKVTESWGERSKTLRGHGFQASSAPLPDPSQNMKSSSATVPAIKKTLQEED